MGVPDITRCALVFSLDVIRAGEVQYVVRPPRPFRGKRLLIASSPSSIVDLKVGNQSQIASKSSSIPCAIFTHGALENPSVRERLKSLSYTDEVSDFEPDSLDRSGEVNLSTCQIGQDVSLLIDHPQAEFFLAVLIGIEVR